jgi:hypothetical protein
MRSELSVPNDPDAPIWRYVDLFKFVAMLNEGGLYFCRADLFKDTFEGTFTPQSIDTYRKHLATVAPHLSATTWPEILSNIRKNSYVSCWHLSEVESADLWRLYGNTIAIRSTYRNLCRFLPLDRFDIGMATYIDYVNDHPDVSHTAAPLFFKRDSLAHERELRAVTQIHTFEGDRQVPDPTPGFEGQYALGDLNDLVVELVVAPDMPSWMREQVFKLSRHYGLDKVCSPSSLR